MRIYNTLTRKEELFEPIHKDRVGIYVCGPTVYGDPHLGHARPAITFDVLFRYLLAQGYKVRYVRNITDVGHLENDADAGEDKIAKKARLEQLEPMEVAQYYTNRYHKAMDMLNCLSPSIEPHASGHIMEQIDIVKTIIEKGYGYVSDGSVYFDVEKYNQDYKYGILSGRVLEELISNTRNLDGQSEKRNSADFALWKKASPEHIMRWNSPWSVGFPGWHLECTAMGSKYLGEMFDIHGGGMDLQFPHHESEIAQGQVSHGCMPAKYWMHNNMITINGQKMGKSLGNFITLEEFFTGSNSNLEKAYSPMNIRFFILQAHYRSQLDFSNEALQAAEKGMKRLMEAAKTLDKLSATVKGGFDVAEFESRCFDAMDSDLNTPILISHLFDTVKSINTINDGKDSISEEDLAKLKELFGKFVFDILGLKDEMESSDNNNVINGLMDLVLSLRTDVRERKDWATSDLIRDKLKELNITVKDSKTGSNWSLD